MPTILNPIKHLETSLKHLFNNAAFKKSRKTLRPLWNIFEIFIKFHWVTIETLLTHPLNFQEIPLKDHPQNPLKLVWNKLQTPILIFSRNTLEMLMLHPWNMLDTSLTHHENLLETPLNTIETCMNTFETSLIPFWTILEKSLWHSWNTIKLNSNVQNPTPKHF